MIWIDVKFEAVMGYFDQILSYLVLNMTQKRHASEALTKLYIFCKKRKIPTIWITADNFVFWEDLTKAVTK